MKGVLECAGELRKTKVKQKVDSRLKGFRAAGRKNCKEIFKELCFCILTANFSAERAIEIQKGIGDGFINLPEKKLARKLKELGYRYPNVRAKFIAEARKHKDFLKRIIDSHENERHLREWFVKNVKGLGYKEASHFLRNIGFSNLAILDFHIIDILETYNVIERPKTLTRRKYLEIENALERISERLGMTLGELDLYLWYAETGKILK